MNKKVAGMSEYVDSTKKMLESKIDSFRTIDSNLMKIRTEVNTLTEFSYSMKAELWEKSKQMAL